MRYGMAKKKAVRAKPVEASRRKTLAGGAREQEELESQYMQYMTAEAKVLEEIEQQIKAWTNLRTRVKSVRGTF